MHFLLPLKSDKSHFCTHIGKVPPGEGLEPTFSRRQSLYFNLRMKTPFTFAAVNFLDTHGQDNPRIMRLQDQLGLFVLTSSLGEIFFLPLASIYDTDRCNRGKKNQNRSKPCGAVGTRVQCEKQSLVLFKPPDLSVPRFCRCRCKGWHREHLLCTYCVLAHS